MDYLLKLYDIINRGGNVIFSEKYKYLLNGVHNFDS